MKILVICIVFGTIAYLVSAKSVAKRDCCSTPCKSDCDCRPCSSEYSDCNSETCNSGYSNKKANCNKKSQCSDNNKDIIPDEILPVLVPFPQNISAIPSSSPTTINNTNVNNATLEITVTNGINTVNNISVPISLNSTNQNTVVIHLEETKEYDQIKSSEDIEEPNCCYVVGKKCDANNTCTLERRKECSDICQGILPEEHLPQPAIQSTPEINSTTVFQPPINGIYQPILQRFPFQSYPLQQYPLQPLPIIQPPCSINSGSPCSQSAAQPLNQISIQQPFQPQPQILLQPQPQILLQPQQSSPQSVGTIQPVANNVTVNQPPVNYIRLFYQLTPLQQLPPIQSPCSIKSASPCGQLPSPIQPLAQMSFQTPVQPLSQISIQPQPQILIPGQQSLQRVFIQPLIQPTGNCGNQAQPLLFPNYPFSPCNQINSQPDLSLSVTQPKFDFNPYYLKPACSYQNPPLNQLSNFYINCSVPNLNQLSSYQQLTDVYSGPQQLQGSFRLENQSATLQRLLTTLQQPLVQNQPLQVNWYQPNGFSPLAQKK